MFMVPIFKYLCFFNFVYVQAYRIFIILSMPIETKKTQKLFHRPYIDFRFLFGYTKVSLHPPLFHDLSHYTQS